MRNKLISILICGLLLITVLPTLADDNFENSNMILNQYSNFYTLKVILIGMIKEKMAGDITSFSTIYVLCFTIINHNGVKTNVINISKNVKIDFDMSLYHFRGIILKHFICGIFNFPIIATSPGSIVYNRPVDLKTVIKTNKCGISGVLVNISIPGISKEMSEKTNIQGEAIFSFTPPTTGNIKMKIENKLMDLIVPIEPWKIHIGANLEVYEEDDFIVLIRNGTASGEDIEGADVRFNKETTSSNIFGEVTFTAPKVKSDKEFIILATKDGYAEDSKTITVKNKPKFV